MLYQIMGSAREVQLYSMMENNSAIPSALIICSFEHPKISSRDEGSDEPLTRN